MEIGSAKYGNETRAKKNFYSLKDGTQVFRILPPMGELAASGKWSVYYALHFGYKNQEGRMRVFNSPEQKRQGKVSVSDAAKDRLQAAEAALEEAKRSNNVQAIAHIEGFLDSYNLDKKHHMNVMTLDGQIGVLKIPHKAKLALDAEIEKLRSEGVDPLSVDNGRYFSFSRSGRGRDTLHPVTVYKEKQTVNGRSGEFEVVHSLNAEIIARLGREASQLNKLYITPTEEQVKQIVAADSSGDYTQIDNILGIKQAESAQPQASVPTPFSVTVQNGPLQINGYSTGIVNATLTGPALPPGSIQANPVVVAPLTVGSSGQASAAQTLASPQPQAVTGPDDLANFLKAHGVS